MRERLYATVKEQEVFNRRHYKFYPKWWTFHDTNLLTKKQSDSMDIEEVEAHLRSRLEKVFQEEVPQIEAALPPLVEELEAEYRESEN